MNIFPDIEPLLDGITADLGLFLMQGSLFAGAFFLVFLVFFVTRDILLRTSSLLYQVFCILLVAVFPLFGFFVYLLVRPARTLKEKELERVLREIQHSLASSSLSVSSGPVPARSPAFTVSAVEQPASRQKGKKKVGK